VAERGTTAERLVRALGAVLGVDDFPWRVRAWDGSEAGPPRAPRIALRSPVAVRRMIWAPGELGLVRAYVAGDIDIDGDLFETLDALSPVGRLSTEGTFARPTARAWLEFAGTAAALGVLGPPPPPPPEEFRRARRSRLHSRDRDTAAVAHHYDVGNDFYALVLGPTLVYSCAVWTDEDTGLDLAQEAKLDLVCRKLGLRPGMRMLDVGCGWGSLALHAAQRYGVDVVGVTLSAEQAELARRRVTSAELDGRITIRVQDYREVSDGPFDAIASIGMAEHVGRTAMAGYVRALHGLLRPGGRLLNHAIAWSADPTTWDDDTLISRYVFPDGELLPLAETVAAVEAGGFEVLDVEALRRHYALTLRAWVERLEKHWDEAVALTSEGRARVWRLYMAASALSFEAGKLGVDQVLAVRPGGEPPPLRRSDWV
jgi:cyclopropane-fatty-acyl-phospholipid synthase